MKNNSFSSRMHQAAHTYVERLGWYVFPLGNRSKEPICSGGHKSASNDVDQIRKWWTDSPSSNVGVALKPSGLLVLDFDTSAEINAHDALLELQNEFELLPLTPCSITGKGLHFVFKCSGSVGRKIKARPGVDILGDGYFIAPPSIHPSGHEYMWDSGVHPLESSISQTPPWVAQLVTDQNLSRALPTQFWIDLLSKPISEGGRNDRLARITGHLLRRYVDPYLVLAIAKTLNRELAKPPLSNDEVERLVDSISKIEKRRRESKSGVFHG